MMKWIIKKKRIKSSEPIEINNFDETAYLSANKDVKMAIEKGDFRDAKHHLKLFGFKEIKAGKRKFHTDFSEFDEKLYSKLFPEVTELIQNGKLSSAYEHFRTKGYEDICKGKTDLSTLEIIQKGFNFDFKNLDMAKIVELNPLLKDLSRQEIYTTILQIKKINPIRLSADAGFDAEFYLELGKWYMQHGKKENALQLLLYSLYLKPTDSCQELIGNYYLDTGKYKQALKFYMEEFKKNELPSVWLYINLSTVYRKLYSFFEALDIIVRGLKHFPYNSRLLKTLDETINEAWEYEQENFLALAEMNRRTELIEEVDVLISKFFQSYQNVFSAEGKVNENILLNTKNVLIIGDYHIPQCIRYRIDQKEEQLLLSGYKVTKVSFTELQQRYEEIFFHDIIIYYRVPALPIVVKSIAKARLLGKITFYEIDDLIFDPVYPAPYETYGGNITLTEYAGLVRDIALFRSTPSLCEYAIGSTLPLVRLLEPLVTSHTAFLHRNGLDSLNVYLDKQKNEYINIFYGSGTLAHNSDFLDLTLSALERILKENTNVKLTVVGHLNLPEAFKKLYKQQLVLLEKTSTIEHYWSYLSGADINLAVLHNDPINNCKSELKWFEAACFKIPSVVSNTQNYLDIIEDGQDALIAKTADDWYQAIDLLVKNEVLRQKIGQNAFEKVMSNYSLETLSKNIDTIISIVLNKKSQNE